jgi:collagen type I alpha
MSGSAYTWAGADGGSWTVAGNWNQGTTTAVQAPGSLDLVQFVSFSGTVTGAVGSDILDVGPASTLTLGGSGFFSNITVGQDLAFNAGDATLAIEAGNVVSSTLLNIGSVAGGGGTLVADGTFTTTGGITLGSPGFGATIKVDSGGEVQDSASNLTMGNGGTIAIAPSGRLTLGGAGGGTAGALSIDKGFVFTGIGSVQGNIVDNGSVATANFGNGATVLSVTGNVTGTGSLSAVQELDIGGAVGSGITVSLLGNGGTNAGLLRLAQPLNDAGTIATFSTNSTIALSGLTYDSVVWTPGSFTISGGSGTLTLATTGDFSHQAFVARPDPVSGTDIVAIACFAEGTRIRTVRGPVPVEALREGALLPCRFGGIAPVRWIGRRRVDVRGHANPLDVLPVRVRAHAFADGAPSRDLLLSPDHAVFVDGALIPVKYLIDGTSIVQTRIDPVTYYHIELPEHDVIEAEGLACESWLDLGERGVFDNETAASRPRFPWRARAWDTHACAPLLLHGAALARMRERLARRVVEVVP